ncbi:putative late blight resistance protein homolog R1A-10 [Nicotiana tomentosiformis]|uniref:putative late blight resistance protein homolog R1A-10 n=1 Tax=Nicotiana tomentosiformis TaxID=4098 RepID=UPI00051CAB99|nr:putative late blight resistance protein homolog R1A-10 isoform X1 [Nicotiana tomentosiformis]XP_018623641.1 putative late blight resistance protein homolog R1A-10 isoform X1 [Nicotiana tomentosiformis]XP_033509883.1 putative late blight resistance protein homolog R1A-10 isoform X1 [Nicotiana tomentosiformis]XP_033509884.1 putative late blight resistance protein homolog R1A-10 isoform X1 [Nicotiana tomentosiformis]XP_033509885.1 putative late blight resistance protein homolog R1A-10 isoform X
MAYVAVISLAQTLEELVQQKPHWVSSDDETTKMLHSFRVSLKNFQDFLENTSKRRQHCGEVEELDREIRTAVEEVEDVIELKIYKTMKREALSKTLRTLVEKIEALKRGVMGCRFGKSKVLRKTMEEEALHKTLSPLVEKIDVLERNVMGSSFGTNEVQGYVDPTNDELQVEASLLGHSSSRRVAKLNPENIVVGLEDDLMEIKRRLIGTSSNREIVPILGMGGIGKTTLARKAYDDFEVRHRFDIHVWVTVSQQYRIRDLLLDILSRISADPIKQGTNSDQLMDKIYKVLKCRRYLLVMDDIWSCDNIWDIVSRTFPEDENSSRIILTSRINEVAMHADPNCTPYEMHLLNLDESWKLIHDKVFGVDQQFCPPELEEIGKQVAQNCQGLPLALLVVAGHLSKIDRTRKSWEDVSKSVSNILVNESDICLGVLAMSYNYLPYHLRPCFLYIGVFPEDREINITNLINLWISEGFLVNKGLKSLEAVGRDCLNDLVSRNLLMVRSRRWDGECKTFGVHDLVRDLILRVANDEKFLQVSRIQVATNPSANKFHVRRYSYSSRIYDDDDLCESSSSSSTRTLHFFYGLNNDSLLGQFKLLRVLAILDCTFHYFPLVIKKLVHLRYLHIFNCHEYIHSSVSELYNLQTLIFGQYSGLPVEIWKMKILRHLEVKRISYFCVPSSKEGSSFKLQNLEQLSYLNISCCTEKLFSGIPNLKRLKIYGDKGNMTSEKLNSLSCLNKLETLKITCYRGYYERPPQSKFALPTSLKRLTLESTYLPWEDMANIVMLPNLQVLKIKDNGFVDGRWRLNDEMIFNQLKFLLIHKTDLEQWKAGSVNFPELQCLVLKECISLKKIPQDIGEIYTLESIELHNCSTSAENSVKKIQKEQKSMGNDCLTVLVNSRR